MNSILILTPLLRKISDGKLFKQIFSLTFKVLALIFLVSIIWIIWKIFGKFPEKTPTNVLIGMIFMGIFFSAGCFASFNILWVRGGDIKSLPLVRDYSVTPIMVIILKTYGEIFFSLILFTGVGTGLSKLIAGPAFPKLIPVTIPLLYKSSGLLDMVISIIAGFAILFTFYFFAEQLGALVDNAKNTRQLVTLGIQKIKGVKR